MREYEICDHHSIPSDGEVPPYGVLSCFTDMISDGGTDLLPHVAWRESLMWVGRVVNAETTWVPYLLQSSNFISSVDPVQLVSEVGQRCKGDREEKEG